MLPNGDFGAYYIIPRVLMSCLFYEASNLIGFKIQIVFVVEAQNSVKFLHSYVTWLESALYVCISLSRIFKWYFNYFVRCKLSLTSGQILWNGKLTQSCSFLPSVDFLPGCAYFYNSPFSAGCCFFFCSLFRVYSYYIWEEQSDRSFFKKYKTDRNKNEM